MFVDQQGLPKSAEVFRAEPAQAQAQAAFGENAIAAVMQWRFNPAKHEGKATGGFVIVPIDFREHD